MGTDPTRTPAGSSLVEPHMMTVVRGGADLLDEVRAAAEQEYEHAYERGEDELHAALRAVDPLIRRDELESFLELLRSEIGHSGAGVEMGGMTAGLYRAIDLLQHRRIALVA